MKLFFSGHRRSRDRNGVIYIAVLAISTLVLVMAMGALLAARGLARASTVYGNADDATNYAFSAVEMGRLMITNDTYWRADYSPGNWLTNKNIGSGTMSLNVSTADSTFSNLTENITLLGTGVKGTATQKLKATLHSVITPLSCLSSVITVNGAASLGNMTVNAATAGLSCNGNVSASGSVSIAVSAAGTVSGSGYQQQVVSSATAVTLPTSSTIFTLADYSTNATSITYSTLPSNGRMKNLLLSPAVNPFGSGNAKGLYVINCGGKNITIDTVRIVGTLILLNAGTVTLSGSINWAPAVTDYPCLLVQGGPLNINFTNNSLSDGGPNGNLNPASTPYPYPGGASNSSSSDTYPSIISGLIYTTGNVTIGATPSIGILVVGGTLTGGGTLSPIYDATYYSNPPPGFYTNTLTTDSNTYSRSVN